jgi:hypothetical protein
MKDNQHNNLSNSMKGDLEHEIRQLKNEIK